jgi:hypothetical protein
VVPGGCRSELTFTFVGKLDLVVGFMLCGCASVFTLVLVSLVALVSLSSLSQERRFLLFSYDSS